MDKLPKQIEQAISDAAKEEVAPNQAFLNAMAAFRQGITEFPDGSIVGIDNKLLVKERGEWLEVE